MTDTNAEMWTGSESEREIEGKKKKQHPELVTVASLIGGVWSTQTLKVDLRRKLQLAHFIFFWDSCLVWEVSSSF